MGVDAYAYMRLGIPVKRDHFYHRTGQKRICRSHPGIEIGDDVNFCSKCGGKIQAVPIETPTKGCVALAKELDIDDPTDVWDCLKDSGELCSSKGETSNLDVSEPDLLCVELSSAGGWSTRSSPVFKKELVEAEEKLRHFMDMLGLTGSPALYCQLYMSC